MEEFELLHGMLEMHGLQKGDKVECTYSDSNYYTSGRVYTVSKNYYGNLFVPGDANFFSGYRPDVRFRCISEKTKKSDFQNTLEYLDTFGIPAEVTDKGMHMEGELTKVQWLDFAKILLEGEE